MSTRTSDAGDLQACGRDECGRFMPGVSGNPGGKRAGTVSLKRLLEACLELPPPDDATSVWWPVNATSYCEAIVIRTLEDAVRGDAAARKLVFDYCEGRPAQHVDVSGMPCVPIIDDIPRQLGLYAQEALALVEAEQERMAAECE